MDRNSEHLVVFSADLHGNETQYRKLVSFVVSEKAKTLIVGGDIAPYNMDTRQLIRGQRYFLSKKLPNLLFPLRKKLTDCRVYLIMGNDDCACNLDVLERDDGTFHMIHARRYELTEDFDIVGYSTVPITPFMLKDWEKFDLSEVPSDLTTEYAERKSWNYRLDGLKSTLKGFEPFRFNKDMENEDSIQRDLKESVFTKKPKKTVFVIHTPPDQTNLDKCYEGRHVGSMAVRLFIEKHQPYLTLHGHIHEAVTMSKDFKQITGTSISLSAGNDNFGSNLAVLTFNLYEPEKAERKVI